uniref:Tuliposide A-converting enzyme 2, chloroplastic-like n=1 Tax=Elaeis guineensis var. tenera TaxID=51953 RepID=A0A6I9SNU6_ELAGV|nr:tuliposide A-converting enzyme 2, chloroplastic-like [Elaeis guineensis]
MDPDTEIQFEFFPFIRQYKSGRTERFFPIDKVPSTVDPVTGVTSKDVVIDPDTGVSARLYLPNLHDTPPKKLPVFVYFHGGGFVIGSAFSPTTHAYLNSLVARANVIAVSVDYRLAPENPLPTAYNDSWAVLKWIASHAPGGGAETWLAEYGDFQRVYLAGCSAGANIAHHMALRAGAEELEGGVRIEGAILVHPYFWGNKAFDAEMVKKRADWFWTLICPGTVGLADPLINPVAEAAPSLKGLACERVLVCVAKFDLLRESGREYYEELKGSGWGGEVELFESEGEDHAFHVRKLNSQKALELMERVVAFANGN